MAVQPAESYPSDELAAINPDIANFAGETIAAEVIDFPSRPGMEVALTLLNWSRRNPYFNAVAFERDAEGLFYTRPDGSRAPLS